MLVDKSTVARQASVLEDGGFITRTPSPKDKRVLQLYPTEKTLELLPKLTQAMDSWEQELLQDLTSEEKAVFESLFAKVCARAEQEE